LQNPLFVFVQRFTTGPEGAVFRVFPSSRRSPIAVAADRPSLDFRWNWHKFRPSSQQMRGRRSGLSSRGPGHGETGAETGAEDAGCDDLCDRRRGGGIYILCALAWLWAAEGYRPDRWDITGAALCLAGASVILYGPRVS
jgi:hypothetical protein